MNDDELKKWIREIPSPTASNAFKERVVEQLMAIKNDQSQAMYNGSSITLGHKKNYWQAMILATMLVATVFVVHDHQKNNHTDIDDLIAPSSMSELTLSTL